MDVNKLIEIKPNPSVTWSYIFDFLKSYSNVLEYQYIKKIRNNELFSWEELDAMLKELHEKLDELRN